MGSGQVSYHFTSFIMKADTAVLTRQASPAAIVYVIFPTRPYNHAPAARRYRPRRAVVLHNSCRIHSGSRTLLSPAFRGAYPPQCSYLLLLTSLNRLNIHLRHLIQTAYIPTLSRSWCSHSSLLPATRHRLRSSLNSGPGLGCRSALYSTIVL